VETGSRAHACDSSPEASQPPSTDPPITSVEQFPVGAVTGLQSRIASCQPPNAGRAPHRFAALVDAKRIG
jgi:hypothetical protein